MTTRLTDIGDALERASEHDVEQSNRGSDHEGANKRLQIDWLGEQEQVVFERQFVGELLRLGLQKTYRQQQRIWQREEHQHE